MVNPDEGHSTGESRRDYLTLFVRLCACNGPQPSNTDAKIEGHEAWCPYRIEVEGKGNGNPS